MLGCLNLEIGRAMEALEFEKNMSDRDLADLDTSDHEIDRLITDNQALVIKTCLSHFYFVTDPGTTEEVEN